MTKNALSLALVVGLSGLAAPSYAAETPALTLKTGYRALTLPLPANRLVNVKPGDSVDVLVTFEWRLGEKAKEKEPITATLLQNILVLKTTPFDKETSTVELVVNPNEAQYAVLAMQPGYSVWLIVRADGDKEMHPMEMANFTKLFR